MGTEKSTKLNQLQRLLPEGLLVNAAWLEDQGYSSALRRKYVASGWLEQPTRGVYCRPSGSLRWQQVVISLQTLLEMPLIVGGRTALELHGFAHYLSSAGPREVFLYGDKPPPGWLSKLELDVFFAYRNSKRIFDEEPIARGFGSVGFDLHTNQSHPNDLIHGSTMDKPWGHWEWPLTLSTPERAVLELLDEVPKRETFHQADMLMEGLRTLSPHRLQNLLVDCRSIKVKRLFLWFAERHGFRWLNQIDRDSIDLGSGKRMLAKGGKLDPTYLITVPEDLHGSG